MEALHATSVAPSLSWKDSLKSPSRLNGKRCEQKWEGRFGSGPCMFRFQALKVESRSSISSWPTRDSAQCNSSVGGSGIRHRNLGQNFSGGNHAVAGRASPWTTSDDDEETSYVQPRVKMLQDAVGPNKTLLDAQARVCTGPTQTRPLDEAQAFKVLNTVLQSGTLLLHNFLSVFLSFHFETGSIGVITLRLLLMIRRIGSSCREFLFRIRSKF